MSSLEISVFPTEDVLARSIGSRILTAILREHEFGREAHICLTGGRGGFAALDAVRRSPRCDSVDWARVHAWWSDERYLPHGDSERNATQSGDALLNHIDIPAANVHPMAASDRSPDVSAAAEQYAAELAAFGEPGPRFAISILGMGEDGHVASLFPEHPGLREQRVAFPVLNSPKPPPVRVSMSFATINLAREVILVAFGSGKADAVGVLLNDAGPLAVPAAGVHGTEQTILAIDIAAAAALPPGMSRYATL